MKKNFQRNPRRYFLKNPQIAQIAEYISKRIPVGISGFTLECFSKGISEEIPGIFKKESQEVFLNNFLEKFVEKLRGKPPPEKFIEVFKFFSGALCEHVCERMPIGIRGKNA